MKKTLLPLLAAAAFSVSTLMPNMASADVILSSEFDGVTASGTTLNNVSWTTSPAATSPSTSISVVNGTIGNTLSGNFVVGVASHFNVFNNIGNGGDWAVTIDSLAVGGDDIELTDLVIDFARFNNTGTIPNTNPVDPIFTVTVFDAGTTNSLGSGSVAFPSGSSAGASSTVSLASVGTLVAGSSYDIEIDVEGAAGGANGYNIGFDSIALSGDVVAVPEPGSLMALGCVGVAMLGRRRR